MTSALEPIEKDSAPPKRRRGQRGPDISGHDVADILRWHTQGLTQVEIAAKLKPPRAQSAISEILSKFGPDRTAGAKAILRAGAADMALNVVRNGKPKDHNEALKGIGVLDEAQQTGLTVIVGGDATVNIGVLLSPLSHASSTERIP